MKESAGFGKWFLGYLQGLGIDRQVITSKLGKDPSQFSKLVNGHQDLTAEQYLLIGVAVGEVKTEAALGASNRERLKAA